MSIVGKKSGAFNFVQPFSKWCLENLDFMLVILCTRSSEASSSTSESWESVLSEDSKYLSFTSLLISSGLQLLILLRAYL